jgi:hypothetical protein
MIAQGEAVTWPKVGPGRYRYFTVIDSDQLHMIENRYRLEKQIYLGRQALRRSPQVREHATLDMASQLAKAVETLSREGRSVTPNREPPLSLDTDAEKDLAHGAEHYYRSTRHLRRSAHAQGSGSAINRKSMADAAPNVVPGARNTSRRKAVAGLFIGQHVHNDGVAARTPSPQGSQDAVGLMPDSPPAGASTPSPRASTPPSGNTLLHRLRTTSFPSFSPFSSAKDKGKEREVAANAKVADPEDEWTSDSSLEDDGTLEDVQRHISSAAMMRNMAHDETEF